MRSYRSKRVNRPQQETAGSGNTLLTIILKTSDQYLDDAQGSVYAVDGEPCYVTDGGQQYPCAALAFESNGTDCRPYCCLKFLPLGRRARKEFSLGGGTFSPVALQSNNGLEKARLQPAFVCRSFFILHNPYTCGCTPPGGQIPGPHAYARVDDIICKGPCASVNTLLSMTSALQEGSGRVTTSSRGARRSCPEALQFPFHGFLYADTFHTRDFFP